MNEDLSFRENKKYRKKNKNDKEMIKVYYLKK